MIQNSNGLLFNVRGNSLQRWGKDQTGQITYQINNQGFRDIRKYDTVPDYAFFGGSTVFGIGVEYSKTLVSYFANAHNYGIAGEYSNRDSVVNLKNFLESPVYNTSVKLIFFWVEREHEQVEQMIQEVNQISHNILHISQGPRIAGTVNLMPQIDSDVSGTHPGPNTHKLWAKTIELLLK